MLLTALVARFGGAWLLDIEPGIVALSLQSMAHTSHCQAVTAFLKQLLSKTLLECNEGKRPSQSTGEALIAAKRASALLARAMASTLCLSANHVIISYLPNMHEMGGLKATITATAKESRS